MVQKSSAREAVAEGRRIQEKIDGTTKPAKSQSEKRQYELLPIIGGYRE